MSNRDDVQSLSKLEFCRPKPSQLYLTTVQSAFDSDMRYKFCHEQNCVSLTVYTITLTWLDVDVYLTYLPLKRNIKLKMLKTRSCGRFFHKLFRLNSRYLQLDCFPYTRTYLKDSLSAHGGVIKRLKMLTYCLYAALFRRCQPCPEPFYFCDTFKSILLWNVNANGQGNDVCWISPPGCIQTIVSISAGFLPCEKAGEFHDVHYQGPSAYFPRSCPWRLASETLRLLKRSG